MPPSFSLLALALLVSPLARAGILDNGDLDGFERRAAYYGGFALGIQPQVDCPAGSVSCSETDSTGGPCCPASTFCATTGNYCCTSSADCSSQIMANPTCADPSWVLFTAGQLGVGLVEGICCPVGMVVDIGLECATPGGSGVVSAVVTAIATGYTTASQANDAEPPAGTVSKAAATGAAAPTGSSAGAPAATTGSATAGGAATQATAPSATTTAKKSNGNTLKATGGFMGWTITFCALFF